MADSLVVNVTAQLAAGIFREADRLRERGDDRRAAATEREAERLLASAGIGSRTEAEAKAEQRVAARPTKGRDA